MLKADGMSWGKNPKTDEFYIDVDFENSPSERVWVDILPTGKIQITREVEDTVTTIFLHRDVFARIAASLIEGEIE